MKTLKYNPALKKARQNACLQLNYLIIERAEVPLEKMYHIKLHGYIVKIQ